MADTYFFLETIAVSGFTWKEHVNSNAIVEYSYSAHFAVVLLVLRITASCKGKYLLDHVYQAFQPFFHFFPVSSTLGGRNLFLPGRFKPGSTPVSSTRWKKPANPDHTLFWACNYLSMLGLKLIHVSKRGQWWQTINKTNTEKYRWLILVFLTVDHRYSAEDELTRWFFGYIYEISFSRDV